MKEILFMEPVFKEMLWGGERLRTQFGYDIPSAHTGECWAVAAHANGDTRVKNGRFAGRTLGSLWKEERALFGQLSGDVFPLLVKIIDAKEDLSIQVHPDDAYAGARENGALGKTECWYVLDCDEDGEIVIGHHAPDKETLRTLISEGRFEELIRVQPVKAGDFFQITPGTVHAIKKGTLILETQQNSDITYRLYDYGRLQDGKPRALHLEQSMDVIRCPYVPTVDKAAAEPDAPLVSCDYYTVYLVEVNGTKTRTQKEPFTICSVIAGEGEIDGQAIKKGDHFLLPAGYGDYTLRGDLRLIISHV